MKLCPLGFQNFVSIETPVKQLVGEVKVKLMCAFSTNIKAKAKRNVSTLGAFAEHPLLWKRKWRPKLCLVRCDLIKKWLLQSEKLDLDYINQIFIIALIWDLKFYSKT